MQFGAQCEAGTMCMNFKGQSVNASFAVCFAGGTARRDSKDAG